jgi:regulator of protease activity HflC (stomatin/prohibitin superfamily)
MAIPLGDRVDTLSFDPHSDNRRKLRRIAIGVSAVLGLLVLSQNVFTYVDPGYVGIVIHRAGGGVDAVPLGPGIHSRIPFATGIEKYPVFLKTIVLAKASTEGTNLNDEINVNSVEGQPLSLDVSLSFQLDPAQTPKLYTTFRTDINAITHGFVKQTIRQALQEVVGTEPVADVIGPKKAEATARVRALISQRLQPLGFDVKQFTINELRAPPAVMEAINQKNVMQQQALTAQNELQKNTFNAQGDSIRRPAAPRPSLPRPRRRRGRTPCCRRASRRRSCSTRSRRSGTASCRRSVAEAHRSSSSRPSRRSSQDESAGQQQVQCAAQRGDARTCQPAADHVGAPVPAQGHATHAGEEQHRYRDADRDGQRHQALRHEHVHARRHDRSRIRGVPARVGRFRLVPRERAGGTVAVVDELHGVMRDDPAQRGGGEGQQESRVRSAARHHEDQGARRGDRWMYELLARERRDARQRMHAVAVHDRPRLQLVVQSLDRCRAGREREQHGGRSREGGDEVQIRHASL